MEDIKILRELASEYASIANDERQQENIILQTRMNDLNMIKPNVLINEIPWSEMNFDGSLTIKCVDEDFKNVERYFRTTIYRWKHMPGNMVVTPYYAVAKQINSTGTGADVKEETVATNDANNVVSHKYEDQIKCMEDLEMLHNPVITYDEENTKKLYNKISNVIGDILPVKIVGACSGGYQLCYNSWDVIATLMSAEDLLYNMIDEPELMHALVQKLSDIFASNLKQLEDLNLLDPDPVVTHCSAAFSNDLKKEKVDYNHVTAKNCWGRGIAQILASVSPAMHDEFEVQYAKKALEPFGLVYYGCCEPLDTKIDIIRQIKNLRKISISPWANVAIAAEAIGKDYVLSAKPNPSNLALGKIDREVITKEINNILDNCYKNNCSCEILLKDISTVGGNPQALFEWEKFVMEIVRNR